MARYVAVRLDDELSDEEAISLLSDFVAISEQDFPGQLWDVGVIELGWHTMVSGSRTWKTPSLIRTKF